MEEEGGCGFESDGFGEVSDGLSVVIEEEACFAAVVKGAGIFGIEFEAGGEVCDGRLVLLMGQVGNSAEMQVFRGTAASDECIEFGDGVIEGDGFLFPDPAAFFCDPEPFAVGQGDGVDISEPCGPDGGIGGFELSAGFGDDDLRADSRIGFADCGRWGRWVLRCWGGLGECGKWCKGRDEAQGCDLDEGGPGGLVGLHCGSHP
ncbi:MAG: hypothetical protein RL215_2271 [Planctomycetota bacterium]